MNKVESLITSYVPLAKSLAKRYPSLPYDDRLQEALLGLTIAANTFDAEKGAFGPYASVIIRNRLTQMLGTYLREHTENPTYPFSSLEQADAEGDTSFAASIADKGDDFAVLDMALTINTLVEAMPELTRSVFALHMAEWHQSDIAKTIGSSQPTVSRIISRMRETIANAVEVAV